MSEQGKGEIHMGKYKVVMSGKTWPNAYEKLAEHCDIQMWEGEGKIPQETLRDWLRDADGFFNMATSQWTKSC